MRIWAEKNYRGVYCSTVANSKTAGKQPHVQQYEGCFSNLYPYAVIQNHSVEIYSWLALLVAYLISFPLFFSANGTHRLFRAAVFTAPGTKIITTILFPLSQLPLPLRMNLWSSSGQLYIKGSLLGTNGNIFAFLIKRTDMVDATNHLLWTSCYVRLIYLLSKGSPGFLLFSQVPLTMVDSAICCSDMPSQVQAIGSTAGWQPSSASYLQELYSV